MAQIVLGIGTSHGPLLSTPPEQWDLRVEADRQNPAHPFRGRTYSFDELVRMRSAEGLERQSSLATRRERHGACQSALARLAGLIAEVKPDAAVIVGNDQMEIFSDANIPAFMLYFGPTIANIPYSEVQKARLPPGIAIAESGYHGERAEILPGLPELGRHLIARLTERGFDVAASQRLPEIAESYSSGIPHAYGFVFRQLFKGSVIPSVPVFVNTFYPPNQPTVQRCFDFGVAIAESIASWDSARRVVVIGSGGMSHFAVDEDLDRRFLEALGQRDRAALLAIPPHSYVSGTSELKNWVPLAGAMFSAGLEMTLVDYVACYRSAAGTGSGMAFAYWN
jgi:3-O-methylgallate 3,4-dioxygenase